MVRFRRIRRRIAIVQTFLGTPLIQLSLANLSQMRKDTETEQTLLIISGISRQIRAFLEIFF